MLTYFGGSEGNNAFFAIIARGDNKSMTEFKAGGDNSTVNSPELEDGLDHHLVSIASADSLMWYVDGLLKGKVAMNNNSIANLDMTNAWLGKGGWPDPTWMGSIHEYNIYEGVMSAAEVKSKAGEFLGLLKDATLSTLTVGSGNLKPAFNPEVTEYTVTLPIGTTEISAATAVTTDPNASVSLNSGSIDLTSGEAQESILVVAENTDFDQMYTINYVVDAPLTLNHSYDFEDGLATDVISGADGLIEGGQVIDGVYIASDDGHFITLPGSEIALNTYTSITTELMVTAGDAVNDAYAMLMYFGEGQGNNAYFNIIARGDDKSRSGISGPSGEIGADGAELEDGANHHLVSVLTADSIAWYVDGALVAKNFVENNSIASLAMTDAWLCKGGWPDPTWKGSIHEFNIYEGAMNDSIVASHSQLFLSPATGIADNKIQDVLNVYPSVSKGPFTVASNDASGLITVYNLTGQKISQQSVTSTQEKLTIAEAGIYLICLDNNGSRKMAKVICTK
jgi:hypothetical protein